jgi:hypothetical protein
MKMRSCAPIHVRQRYKTVLPKPQGLAVFGSRLFVSFQENPTIFTIDLSSSRCDLLATTPAAAWGLAAAGDRVWAICGYGPDGARHLFEYDVEGNQRSSPIRCPDGTGSYIAHDGHDLYLSQWYEQRVFRLTGAREFEPVIKAKRGICGIAAVDGTLTLLTTADEDLRDYFLERFDLSDPAGGCVDLATVPFRARSLAWTGSEYLTNHREAGEIVAFSLT